MPKTIEPMKATKKAKNTTAPDSAKATKGKPTRSMNFKQVWHKAKQKYTLKPAAIKKTTIAKAKEMLTKRKLKTSVKAKHYENVYVKSEDDSEEEKH